MVNLTMEKNHEQVLKPTWSNLRRAALVFNSSDRKKFLFVTSVQIAFGILDLLGVALIGMVSALIIRGINSDSPGNNVGKFLNLVNIDQLTLKEQVLVLSLGALVVLTGKTVFSVVLLRKTLYYLSRKSASIAKELTSKLLNQTIISINRKSQQERLFSLTSGVSNLTLGVFGSLIVIVSDISLLAILLLGLIVVDTETSILTFLGFSCIGVLLYYLLQSRASKIGLENSRLLVKSNNQIIEALESFREASIRGSKQFYASKIGEVREQISELDAEIKFLPNISKYVSEISIVLGITAISAYQFANSDPQHATAVLTVFLAASTRIAPALMRLQQNLITMKTYLSACEPTLKLSEELNGAGILSQANIDFIDKHPNFIPEVKVQNVSFSYSEFENFSVEDVSLNIQPGTLTALVGPSGSGKSTLADLILGILMPRSGKIEISKLDVLETLKRWPGSIGYVPQKVFITSGTIAENICLGFNLEKVPIQSIWEALDAAELGDFVRNLPLKLDSHIGDGGFNLSGGQRQRIGIARALLTKPLLVVLDEATSALDAEIESRVTESIYSLKGKCTLIVIAHRLSTIRLADQVCYVNEGVIEDIGSFNEVKSRNKEFRNLANLMGL